MAKQPLEVYWSKQLVGLIRDVKIDNFDLYGQWQPIPSESYERFVAECVGDQEPWVVVGRDEDALTAKVQALTATDIEIKIRCGRPLS